MKPPFVPVRTLLAVAILAGCGPAPDQAADAVFVNGGVYTLDDERPWAEAVAVRSGRIVYVGDNDGAQKFLDAKSELVDLQGRMLLPGFIDTHMHPVEGGAYAKALSLDTSAGVDDWVRAIDEYADAHPDAPLIFGYGFLASTFGPDGPTRQRIDAVVDNRPVLIMDEGFHGAWANTRALEKLNVTKDTPDPVPGFSYYKRDAEGVATGYLLEDTASMAMDGLDAISLDTLAEGTAYVIETLNRYGVTSVFDAGASGYEDELDTLYERLADNGDLTVRVVGAYRADGSDDADGAVETARQWGDRLRGDRYHYRVLKIMNDGTIEGRTAAMFEDYQGEPGNSGQTVFSEQRLTGLVTEAATANIDVHVHALGERAVHEALNAIEVARRDRPDSSARYTICHLQVIADQDLPRFAELGVIAQGTPLWASYDTYGKQFVSADQFRRYWRFKSLVDAGVRLTFGSDFPASGAGMAGMSPLLQMEIGHTRQNPGEPDAPVQPRESERLDLESLVRGYTLDAAWQLHLEDQVGSIETGKAADLVVLDRNLFDTGTYEIHDTGVDLTMIGGDIVYRRHE